MLALYCDPKWIRTVPLCLQSNQLIMLICLQSIHQIVVLVYRNLPTRFCVDLPANTTLLLVLYCHPNNPAACTVLLLNLCCSACSQSIFTAPPTAKYNTSPRHCSQPTLTAPLAVTTVYKRELYSLKYNFVVSTVLLQLDKLPRQYACGINKILC